MCQVYRMFGLLESIYNYISLSWEKVNNKTGFRIQINHTVTTMVILEYDFSIISILQRPNYVAVKIKQ